MQWGKSGWLEKKIGYSNKQEKQRVYRSPLYLKVLIRAILLTEKPNLTESISHLSHNRELGHLCPFYKCFSGSCSQEIVPSLAVIVRITHVQNLTLQRLLLEMQEETKFNILSLRQHWFFGIRCSFILHLIVQH